MKHNTESRTSNPEAGYYARDTAGDVDPEVERAALADLDEAESAWRARCLAAWQKTGFVPDRIRWRPPANDTESPRPEHAPNTIAGIVTGWRNGGPAVRVSTGIDQLDELCNGGIQVPRRVFLVGAPGSGKTALAAILAHNLEAAGVMVGWLAIDEDADPDIARRLLQLGGFDRAKLDAHDAGELQAAALAFSDAKFRFYGPDKTIAQAAEALAAEAKACGCAHAVLIVDSIHKAHAPGTSTIRERVEYNTRAVIEASSKHRMIAVGICESNRAWYKDKSDSADVNPLAAAAESRDVEFGGQLVIVLRSESEDQGESAPSVVSTVFVAKNRGERKGRFVMILDPATHAYSCMNAADFEQQKTAKLSAARHARNAQRQLKASIAIAKALQEEPGVSQRRLLEGLKGQGLGDATLTDARASLVKRGALVLVPGSNRTEHHYLNGSKLPADVLAEVPEAAGARPPSGVPEAKS